MMHGEENVSYVGAYVGKTGCPVLPVRTYEMNLIFPKNSGRW